MQKNLKILFIGLFVTLLSYAYAQVPPSHRFEKIIVQGNKRVDAQGVLDYFPKDSQQQYAYSDEDLNTILKDLIKTGLFRDVKFQISGAILTVLVEENQFINQIAFEGNSEVSDDDLKSVINLKPRQPLTLSRVREAEQSILGVCRTKGLYNSQVTSEMIKRESDRVDIIFTIKEGPKAYIRSITFQGNKAFNAATLEKVLSSKEARWYRFFGPPEEVYNAERVNYDSELLRQFYLKNGYAEIKIEASHAELSSDYRGFALTFIINEGCRYKFGDVCVVSEVKSLSTEGLMKEVRWEKGEWFNNQLVQSTCDAIGMALCEKGIPFIEVVPDIDQQGKDVNVKFVIRPTSRSYVDRIIIRGNLGTDDTVIRRELTFAEGDPVNTSKISESEKALQDVDFFETVEISDISGKQADLRDILVKVKEKSTGDIQFGAGYSTNDGAVGRIGYSERNFLGKGYGVHVNSYLARRGFDFDVGADVPHFMGRRMTVGANAFYSQYREDTRGTFSKQGGYRQKVGGLEFNGYYALRKNLYQGWSYKIRRENLKFPNQGMSPYLLANMAGHHNQWVSAIGHDIFFDRIERFSGDAVGGWFVKLSNEWMGVGGNIHALNNTLSGAQFIAFDEDKQVILKCEGRYGLTAKLGYMRFMDQYFLGAFSFPGFAEAGVGPRDANTTDALGGRQYYVAAAKLYFPLGFPKELPVKGIIYAQTGSLWNSIFKGPGIASGNFYNRITAGGGIICTLPFLGKIGIILSKALVRQPQDRRQTPLFIWGQDF